MLSTIQGKARIPPNFAQHGVYAYYITDLRDGRELSVVVFCSMYVYGFGLSPKFLTFLG